MKLWPQLRRMSATSRPGGSPPPRQLRPTLKTPKNGRARRFPLPAVAVEALENHREEQKQSRSVFGNSYRDDLDLVFATPEGNFLKPDSVTAAACLLAQRAGLKGTGLHSLRHSHASQLLAQGVPLPTVSKRLGHSSPNITARIYSHSFAADELAAAQSWDEAMRPAIESGVSRPKN